MDYSTVILDLDPLFYWISLEFTVRFVFQVCASRPLCGLLGREQPRELVAHRWGRRHVARTHELLQHVSSTTSSVCVSTGTHELLQHVSCSNVCVLLDVR